MHVLRTLAILAWAALLSAPAYAIYLRVVTEDVPVARLIDNLTKQVAASPNDGQRQWALARAHAMAASTPAGTVPVTKDGRVWHGHEEPYVPFRQVPAAAPGSAARRHLELAIAHHRKALALLPGEHAVRLGFAWCLQQAGRKADAIREYRAAIDAAWQDEGKRTRLGLGGRTIVSEAASYLLPLLDPATDREEIRTLRQRVDHLASLPVPITPIVVDLEGETSARPLIHAQRRVRFDLEGRGGHGDWEWITPRAAWLVWDPRHTGRVTSGRQLFGSVTFLIAWRTGYDALASLDDDGDGWLRGAELRGLSLWHDRNADGISDGAEVRPLQDHRIVGLRTRGNRGTTADVAAWAPDGVRYADGSSAASYDVILRPAARLWTRGQEPGREAQSGLMRRTHPAANVRRAARVAATAETATELVGVR